MAKNNDSNIGVDEEEYYNDYFADDEENIFHFPKTKVDSKNNDEEECLCFSETWNPQNTKRFRPDLDDNYYYLDNSDNIHDE